MDSEKSYCLYAHINKTNGKIYIGITKQKPEDRWDSGHGYSYNTHFYRAIRKYGWDGFIHRILLTGLSEEQACQAEKMLISDLNTTNPELGYNHHEGGNKPPVMSGESNPFWGNHMFAGEAHPMYGKKHSCETRKKMSENHWDVSGGKNPNAKKVICEETGAIYDSAKDAENDTGIKRNNITAACRKDRQKTAGGYHWNYVA